jgi:hypothetical protein
MRHYLQIVCFALLTVHCIAQGTATVTTGGSGTTVITITVNGSYTITSTTPPPACSPPLYNCDYSASDVVQTPAAPFTALTLTNTKVQESILSKAHIVRITDPTTGGGVCNANNQFNATQSGGDNDIVTNTNTTLVVISCAGSFRYVIGYNPTTMQMFPAPPATLFNCSIGQVAWSRVDPQSLYCRPASGFVTPIGIANGTTLYKVKFPLAGATNLCGLGVGNCPDPSGVPTWTSVLDFGTCPQAPAGPPTAGSVLGVAPSDTSFSSDYSWTGGQGTARYFFQFVPGTGCYTLDTIGDSTHPIWYSPGGVATTLTTNASFTIHDSFTYGTWSSVQRASCTGTDCGPGDGSFVWQFGTSNMIAYAKIPFSGGHFTLTPSYYFSNPNPQFYKSALTSPTTNVQQETMVCPCSDAHFVGDASSDVNPPLGTTGGLLNGTWTTAYRNEVLGWAINGSSSTIWRFAKTYSSGGPNKTGFQAQYSIGSASQDRCTFFFTSDMLGGLGTLPSGLSRWDIFAVGLCGQ